MNTPKTNLQRLQKVTKVPCALCKACRHHQPLSDFLRLEPSKIWIYIMFIFVQTTDGKAPALRVFTVCCASVGVSTESISLQGDCQRVLSGRFMGLWLLGLGGRSPEKTALHQRGSEPLLAPRLTALQYATFSVLFICSAMTPPPSQEGLSFHL